MPFNEPIFRKQWRILCRDKGINPIYGISGAQLVIRRAERDRDQHAARSARALRRFASTHPERFDNGRGQVNWRSVEERCQCDWWCVSAYWRGDAGRRFARLRATPFVVARLLGKADPPTDVQAFRDLREQALKREIEAYRSWLARQFDRTYWPNQDQEFVLLVGEVLFEEQNRSLD